MTFSLTPTPHHRTTQPLLYIYSTPHPSPNIYRPASYLHHPIPHIAPLLSTSCTKTGSLPLYTEAPLRPPAAPTPFHTAVTLLAHLPHPDTSPVLAHIPYATLSLPSGGGVALR